MSEKYLIVSQPEQVPPYDPKAMAEGLGMALLGFLDPLLLAAVALSRRWGVEWPWFALQNQHEERKPAKLVTHADSTAVLSSPKPTGRRGPGSCPSHPRF